jgi:aerobic-type carbon monoxide dehydrogenase small subunit (CoxS/CutS family)
MSSDVKFQVNIQSVVLDADELAELVFFLRSKKFMHKEYVGKDKGFAGGEYDYKLVKCDEKARVDIQPVNEKIWLYLNTFGKEEK